MARHLHSPFSFFALVTAAACLGACSDNGGTDIGEGAGMGAATGMGADAAGGAATGGTPSGMGATAAGGATDPGNAGGGNDAGGADGGARVPFDGTLDAPDSAEALKPWLIAKNYSGWAAEAEYHESMGNGPHGTGVKGFYSPKAAAALKAGMTTFPKGAAVVKELTSEGYLYGWGVWVKVEDDTDAGNGFYWYELIQGEDGDLIFGDARGSTDCVGCHSAGQDFLLLPGTFVEP